MGGGDHAGGVVVDDESSRAHTAADRGETLVGERHLEVLCGHHRVGYAGEDGLVDRRGVLGVAEDHAAARAAEPNETLGLPLDPEGLAAALARP